MVVHDGEEPLTVDLGEHEVELAGGTCAKRGEDLLGVPLALQLFGDQGGGGVRAARRGLAPKVGRDEQRAVAVDHSPASERVAIGRTVRIRAGAAEQIAIETL